MIPSPSTMWQQPQPEDIPSGMSVLVDSDDLSSEIQHSDGSIEIPTPDGGVIIDLAPYLSRQSTVDAKHEDNLADKIDEATLHSIVAPIIEGIEADENSREDYMSTLKAGLDIIGLKMEDPRSDVANSSAPLEGMSTVKHPLLLEACLRSAANERGELLPAEGPAKVENQA